LTGALNISALSSPLTVNSTNSNTYKFNLSSSGVIDSYFGSNNVKLFSIADKNVNELFFIDTLGKVSVNATGVPININSKNNNFYKLLFSNDNSITGYLGSDGSKSLSIADGSANEVAYITYLGDAAFNGNITEAGNNVLTNLDTVSLSNRINGKVSLTGNETISGDKTFTNKIILNDSSRFESDVLFKKNFGLPIVKISNANYTATTANHTIIYTTLTSDKTLTIPNASDAVGIKYTISIFDTPEGNEVLTIVTPSNNSFVITDGEGASVGIVGGYCAILQSDGIKWYVLSYSPMY
jgi:hypothetical protein